MSRARVTHTVTCAVCRRTVGGFVPAGLGATVFPWPHKWTRDGKRVACHGTNQPAQDVVERAP